MKSRHSNCGCGAEIVQIGAGRPRLRCDPCANPEAKPKQAPKVVRQKASYSEVEAICACCRNAFTYMRHGSRKARRFCSADCRNTFHADRPRKPRSKPLELECRNCGGLFASPRAGRSMCGEACESEYQSRAARKAAQRRAEANPKPVLTCAHCQKSFHPSRSSPAQKAAGYVQQCCSVKCRIERERALRPVVSKPVPHSTCKVCSISFPDSSNKRYCSDKCREVVTRMAKSTYSCVSCGSEFAYVKTGGRPRSTCSAECAKKLRDTHKEAGRPARRAAKSRRRARKKAVPTETFTHLEIFQRDGWRCGLCHTKVDQKLAYPDPMSASLDHIVPLAKGGAHARQNVQCAHWICNIRKRDGAGGQLRLFG